MSTHPPTSVDADGTADTDLPPDDDLKTRLARAEAALGESEARFRSALRAGRMGSWETDNIRMTRTWSQEGMDLFGLTLPGGVGQVGGPNDEYVNALHPEDRHLALAYRELADRLDSFPAEYRILKPDGATQWLSGRGLVVSRLPDGRAHRLVSIMADANERKQAEQQLRIERERLDLALSAGQMGAYDLNMSDDSLWWSQQTYVLFGVDPASFAPSRGTIIGLIHPDDRDHFVRCRAEAIAARVPFVHELRIRRPDGRQVWLEYRSQADYASDGRPVRNFGTVLDITERKRSEQLLHDADRQKDNFIATLAHELRNPLAPIRSAIELLRKLDRADPKVAWCHDVIDRQVGQMAHLLDDLLDVSRITRSQFELRLQPVHLATALRHAIEIAQPQIDAGQHALTVELPSEDLTVDGDLTRLAQVFSNLLINAAKYSPTGGRIGLRMRHDADHAVVTVADSGIGIAAEHMSQIFTLFGQVQSALDRSHGGQGIGLSLAKGLVEKHGGSITAHSDGPGKGSQFEVRLPLAPAAVTTSARAAPAAKAAGHYRILIADDMADIADTFALLLEDEGHTVQVAYDGEQALTLAAQFRPEVVILDLGMPKLNGYDVCRRIREAPWGHDMTLVAQTGWGQDDDRRRTRDAGFDLHVVKPIDPFALIASIRRLPEAG